MRKKRVNCSYISLYKQREEFNEMYMYIVIQAAVLFPVTLMRGPEQLVANFS